MLEAKIDELLAKGIRPADIAKIYDLEKKEVISYAWRKRFAEHKEQWRKSIISKFMETAGIDEGSAEKLYNFVLSVFGEPKNFNKVKAKRITPTQGGNP
jgi:hypothetical protein